jgi:hypothetical protein
VLSVKISFHNIKIILVVDDGQLDLELLGELEEELRRRGDEDIDERVAVIVGGLVKVQLQAVHLAVLQEDDPVECVLQRAVLGLVVDENKVEVVGARGLLHDGVGGRKWSINYSQFFWIIQKF